VRRPLPIPSLLVVSALAAGVATPAGAAAAPRVTATPNPIPFGKTLIVKGRGWPVIEFCSRAVRLSLRSDQNAFRIGRDRVGPRGRFRFTWVPRRDEVGRGDWTLVARMRCESGEDGSPNSMRATAPIRIGGSNVVVGRGRTSKGRWVLYARRSRFGVLCTGVRAGPPNGQGFAPSGEGCGGGLRGEPLDLGLFYGRHRGTFAHGRTSPDVARVEVVYGAGEPQQARLFPSPPVLGLRGSFWIAPFSGLCMTVSARPLDGQGRPLGRVEAPKPPPTKPGQPSRQSDKDCPKGP
jgi:hypothetical protein